MILEENTSIEHGKICADHRLLIQNFENYSSQLEKVITGIEEIRKALQGDLSQPNNAGLIAELTQVKNRLVPLESFVNEFKTKTAAILWKIVGACVVTFLATIGVNKFW